MHVDGGEWGGWCCKMCFSFKLRVGKGVFFYKLGIIYKTSLHPSFLAFSPFVIKCSVENENGLKMRDKDILRFENGEVWYGILCW